MHDTGKLKHRLGKMKYENRASIPQVSVNSRLVQLSEMTFFFLINRKRNNGMQFHSTPQDGASKAENGIRRNQYSGLNKTTPGSMHYKN